MCLSVHLVTALESPKRRKALKKLKGRRIVELLPLGYTLQRLASLQTDANHKVSQAASNCLCRAVGYKAFRTKVRTRPIVKLLSHYLLGNTLYDTQYHDTVMTRL